MYVAWCGLSVAFGVLELKIVTQEVLHSGYLSSGDSPVAMWLQTCDHSQPHTRTYTNTHTEPDQTGTDRACTHTAHQTRQAQTEHAHTQHTRPDRHRQSTHTYSTPDQTGRARTHTAHQHAKKLRTSCWQMMLCLVTMVLRPAPPCSNLSTLPSSTVWAQAPSTPNTPNTCLLYTSDAADE